MSLKILAIDDSRTMRNLLQATLCPAGFDVDVAEDGEDGLRVFDDTDPDVVITDIYMPKMEGFGFIEAALCSKWYRVPSSPLLTSGSGRHL